MNSSVIHLASARAIGTTPRRVLTLVIHRSEPKDSHEAVRLSYRGFPTRQRGKWFHRRDMVQAEELFALEADRLGLEVRW